jgi:SAM-dependent methyltransferase
MAALLSILPAELADMRFGWQRETGGSPSWTSPRLRFTKLHQKAQQLDLTLDLLALDAKEYPFQPACFDLIVMFYHFDRDICPQVLSTLKPDGFLICKSSLSWDSYEGVAPVNIRPLARSEILSMLPGLRVMHHQERPVRHRGVVE